MFRLNGKNNNWGWIVVQVAVLVAVVALVKFYAVPDEQKTSTDKSQEGSRPSRPLPQGIQTYSISGNFAGPQTTELTVNPIDAKTGEMQSISVKVSDTNPVTSVTVVITLDNVSKATSANLSLAEGTDLDGIWKGSVAFPDDTLNGNYTITVIAVSTTGVSSIVTTVR